MARLGKRERAAKRAIIHGNLSAPMVRLTKADVTLGASSSERLKAAIHSARGPAWSDRKDYAPKREDRFSLNGYNRPKAEEFKALPRDYRDAQGVLKKHRDYKG